MRYHIFLIVLYSTNKKRPFNVGTSYFPHRRTRKYHGIGVLSLLCSEWEEVGHTRIEHRHQKVVSSAIDLLCGGENRILTSILYQAPVESSVY